MIVAQPVWCEVRLVLPLRRNWSRVATIAIRAAYFEHGVQEVSEEMRCKPDAVGCQVWPLRLGNGGGLTSFQPIKTLFRYRKRSDNSNKNKDYSSL